MSDRLKQKKLFEDINDDKSQEPVECLGMTFENDKKRREYFLDKLREKLKDPEFRKIEGFPIGEDEDILALSDPPYYTACPNPFIEDFVKLHGKSYEQNEQYHREPFAADVSEGKSDPIYNAHSYHTKVPHKAIMRYILHYTDPGDIIFDGFCGTGMTGVAGQMCGDKTIVESLGVTKQSPEQKYKVEDDGTIFERQTNEKDKSTWVPFSKLGVRRAILNDLSPAATFIAYNYNTPVDAIAFECETKRIISEVEKEYGWMYTTIHKTSKNEKYTETQNEEILNNLSCIKNIPWIKTGKINYTIWSDVFICTECSNEVIFWESAIDKEAGKVRDKFSCPNCKTELTKRNMERAWITNYDTGLKKLIKKTKQVPVLINYSVSGIKRRFEKKPDKYDLALIRNIENIDIPYWFPTNRMMFKEGKWGDTWRAGVHAGVTNVHHFYTKRNMFVFSVCFEKLPRYGKWIVSGCLQRGSKQHQIAITRIGGPKAGVGGATAGHRRGTLYIPSNQVEMNPFNLMADRINALKKAIKNSRKNENITMTASLSNDLGIMPETLDYMFFDPPFGANIMYSELNFHWESWMRVWTNIKNEAIENSFQKKYIDDYRKLMTNCFKSAYLFLKPGRWMTVEFSNTKASVWNSIQSSLIEAGFIIANISALDKKRGGLNAIITPTAVKQDLIISAYKPNGGFKKRFISEAKTEEGVWDFIRTHLKYLPVIKKQGANLVPIPERDPRILFDLMVAFYIRHGYPIPISSQEFQKGLTNRYPERDGMFFLPEQVAEYDKKRMKAKEIIQFQLFVSDESSAIQWLKQRITKKTLTFQDIHPQFLKEIGGWQKHEKQLELSELLEQNFIKYDGIGDVPSQIHSYLSSNYKDLRNLEKNDPSLKAKAKDRWYVPDPNKTGDLEKLRERSLLKEFEEYRKSKQKRLKVFRFEAVRAGFKKAWQERDYSTIISVAKKIPEKILQEDPKLLMWYDQALTRSDEDQ